MLPHSPLIYLVAALVIGLLLVGGRLVWMIWAYEEEPQGYSGELLHPNCRTTLIPIVQEKRQDDFWPLGEPDWKFTGMAEWRNNFMKGSH